MRILVVEDEEASLRRFLDALEGEVDTHVEVSTAGSRAVACELLASTEYDFVVCDLHIPHEPGGEPDLSHGVAVYECATSLLPGTPTALITGSGDQRVARELVAARASADLFGVGEPYPMTDFVHKHELDDCIRRIEEVAEQLAVVDSVALVEEERDAPLEGMQARVLRLFARRNGARRVEVRPLGGLSESVALLATLLKEDGTVVASVFAKVAPLEAVADEARRYREAALRLPAGADAPLLDTVEVGAGRTGGLFYGLAERHQSSLFAWLVEHPEEVCGIVTQLREFLGAWRDQDRTETVLVTTLRRGRATSIDLADYAPALGPECFEFEKQPVPIRFSLQHGDLHGENVLVGESAIPMMIDFANVEALPSCFDPVVLELSLIFHPQSPFARHEWPSPEQCARWDDLDAYLEGCPVPEVVRACRDWATSEAASLGSVYAVAYAEALRQLPYADDRLAEHALAIARRAAAAGLRFLDGTEGGEGERD